MFGLTNFGPLLAGSIPQCDLKFLYVSIIIEVESSSTRTFHFYGRYDYVWARLPDANMHLNEYLTFLFVAVMKKHYTYTRLKDPSKPSNVTLKRTKWYVRG